MQKSAYINISSAKDISSRKNKVIYRLFEIIPGALSLGTLLGVFVFSWLAPVWISLFVISFCFYYLLRIFYFSAHQIAGYLKTKKHLKSNWLQKLKKARHNAAPSYNWKDIYHVVILPTYKEGEKIIQESINSLIASDYPKEKLIVILAQEERAGEKF